MNTIKLVFDRTEFKNECTICTSLCGLFLTCRGENKASSSCINIYTHKTVAVILIIFSTTTDIAVWTI